MPRLQIITISVLAALAVAAFALWPRGSKIEPIAPPTAEAPAAKPNRVRLDLNLATAIAEKRVAVELTGNGKDRLAIVVQNESDQPMRLHVPAGQLFASSKSTVAVVQEYEINLEPSGRQAESLKTVATSSSNMMSEDSFSPSHARLPQLDLLFIYLAQHPEVSLGAAQVATLALSENLPVSAFARFAAPDSAAGSRFDKKAFKTDTSDIIAALTTLRQVGLDQRLALTIDPQLKIEAMIDPLAHALAVRYYALTDEWSYWKNELLTGDSATRHYALYGIARFYPDIAVQMLPKWARAAQMSTVYRTSAIQALAETQRPEALAILRQLETELGAATDLGRAARTAAAFLDAQFTKTPASGPGIAFRASRSLPGGAGLAQTN